VEQNVALAQRLEEPIGICRQAHHGRRERSVLQLRPLHQVVDGVDAVEVDGAVGTVDAVFVQLELGRQEAHQTWRRAIFDLKPDDVPFAPVFQRLGDFLKEVVGFVLIDIEL